MLPLSVMRFRLELMPGLAGCTKQKFPTTSTIQKSLSPVAASMIFSVGGTTMRVVYLTLARIGTMSCEWYCTVRADSCATATMDVNARATPATTYRRFMRCLLIGWWWNERRPACEAGTDGPRQDDEARPLFRSAQNSRASLTC